MTQYVIFKWIKLRQKPYKVNFSGFVLKMMKKSLKLSCFVFHSKKPVRKVTSTTELCKKTEKKQSKKLNLLNF